MQTQEDVYTIPEEDVLASLKLEAESRKALRMRVRPDRTPSPTLRPRESSEAHALSASTLSLFICGAGQIYNRQGKLGVLMLLTQIFAAAVNWAVIQLWPSLVEMAGLFGVNEWRLMQGIAAADFLVIVLMVASMYQAYRHAEGESGGYAGADNPLLTGFASLVVPGWGQLANAQAGKAAVFFFSLLSGAYVVVLMKLSPFVRILESVDEAGALTSRVETAAVAILGAAIVMWILAVYDAFLVAGLRRRMA